MQTFIIDIMDKFGYLGISLLIAIENIFPPIPSEIILTFGGFMTTYTTMNVWLVILFATIGSIVGAVALYFLGRFLNVERLERLCEGKLGKLLRLKKEDIAKANAWFQKRGKLTVFFCRFIPIVRSLISVPAGTSKMSLWVFIPLTTLGSLIWNAVLIFLGKLAGATWEKIAGYFDIYSTITLIVLCVVLAVVAFLFIKKRFLNKETTTETDTSAPATANQPSDEPQSAPIKKDSND